MPPITRTSPTSQPTLAEAILKAFENAGIELLFTVPGGPLMPFLRSCKRRRFRKIVIARHETAACIMAASYFHDSGIPAVVALTSGPGAANATNGVLHALREQAALMIVSARPASHKLGRGAVQDLDSARFFAPITKRSEQLIDPAQLEFLATDLLQLAQAPSPGPVNLTVCCDHWDRVLGAPA
jgi:acetolactate synthase I/II/III large subunit